MTKSRARTGYQRELEEHRMRRVEWALRRQRRFLLRETRGLRDGERWLIKATRRLTELPGTYDSEEEEESGGIGLAGLLAKRWDADQVEGESAGIPAGYEPDDLGEEAETWAKLLKRSRRRLDRWDGNSNFSVYNTHASRSLDVDLLPPPPPSKGATNGARKVSKKRPRPREGRERVQNVAPASPEARSSRRQHRDLNDEITQDLLAERSDEEMDGEDYPDGDGYGDGESDVDMD